MNIRKHEKQQQNQILSAKGKARQLSRRLNFKRRAGFGLNEVIGAFYRRDDRCPGHRSRDAQFLPERDYGNDAVVGNHLRRYFRGCLSLN